MRITKLVVLFNKEKIAGGLIVAIMLFVLAYYMNGSITIVASLLGMVILLNIVLALIASYLLYDNSHLYRPAKLLSDLELKKNDSVMLLHASFDPISPKLEEMFGSNLKIYNLYGNRHEHESAVKISEKVFPPNKNEVTINPTSIPDEDGTYNYVLAITSAHEILEHEDRVKFFKESNRVLKNDGTLVLCEQMRNLTNFIFFNIGAFHFVSMKNWKLAFEEAGLEIVKNEPITKWGTKLYLKKK